MTSQTYVIPLALLQTAKEKEIEKISTRVQQRKKKMIDCINKSIIKYNPYFENIFEFDIKEDITQKIYANTIFYASNSINNITNVLSKWNSGHYKRAIRNEKATKKVRTYWNRHKPKPLGDHLFNCIVASLFQYIMNTFEVLLSQKDKLLCFIHIFEDLLNEKIKFPRSSCRPLILRVCLFRNNKFQQFCTKFIDTFGSMTYVWNKSLIKALPEGYIRQIEKTSNFFVPTVIKMLCVKYC
eukprot:293903_1